MSEARVACPDCTVDCNGQRHEIDYCPVHEAAPKMLDALNEITDSRESNFPKDSKEYSVWWLHIRRLARGTIVDLPFSKEMTK